MNQPDPIPGNPSNAGRTCPYCQGVIEEGAQVVRCDACNGICHADCWQENGGCPTLGCGAARTDSGKAGASSDLPPAGAKSDAAAAPQPTAPGQQPATPGQPPAAPGQQPATPGQPPAAPGQPPAAPGQPNAAPGQPNAAPGQPNAAPPTGPPTGAAAAGGNNRNAALIAIGAAAAVVVIGVVIALATGLFSSSAELGDDDVALVGEKHISKSDFDKWMVISAKTQLKGSKVALVANDPPDFRKCAEKVMAEPAKSGGTRPTEAQAKSQCQAAFDAGKPQVMQLLITSRWIEGEADKMGISVSDGDVRKKFEETKKQAFPNDSGYQKFLTDSGETEVDLLSRIRIDLLSTKIKESVQKGGSPSEQQKRLTEFVKTFQADWKKKTTCWKPYAVELCGTVKPGP